MKRYFRKEYLLSIISLIFITSNIFSQSHISTQSHSGSVTNLSCLDNNDNSVFSAGEDGFLIKWTEEGMGEHYQISDLPIKMIARNPNGNEIAVYESDGATLNRISVWNWKTFTRKFAYRFTDSITSLSYSAKGTYIICGSTSVNGTYFLNSNTGSFMQNKLRSKTGLVNFVQTSDSEKSLITYSPKGTLTYYNLKTGNQKAQFNTEYDLSQFCMFNNGVFGAGVRGNSIYVIQAVTGNTLGSYAASKPILIGSNKSKDLYYITSENRQFKLYKIANDRNKAVIMPELQRTFSGLKSGESIVCAELSGNEIYAGTNSGNIYKFDYVQAERVDVQLAISDKMYDKIYDVASAGNNFYFLTQNSLFSSSYESPNINKKASISGYTNILSYGNNIILWAKDSRKAVLMLDISSGQTKQLFSPSGSIQVLKACGNYLIDIESNSSVNMFDIASLKKKELYKGTSIQDAILFNENDLYIAKSSGSTPNQPLIYVNVNTQETVPLSLKGNVAYSLTFNANNNSSEFYGITINKNPSNKKLTTYIFAYKPSTKNYRNLLSIVDEDNEAFATLSENILYTNIGKNQVRSYDISTRREVLYKRSASMPIKTVKNSGKMVVLNRDGSISWYNPNLNSVLADWYLTSDGNWFEF